MRKLFFILSLSALNFTLVAQDSDYVITTKGDTLKGKVNMFLSQKNAQMISIKNDATKEKLKVYEVTLVNYKGAIYHTVKIDNAYQFARLFKSGYISQYEYIDYESDATSFNAKILIKNDGSTFPVRNLTLKKGLVKFMNDCSLVTEKIENKGYKKKDLQLIIEDYNKCIDGKSNAGEMDSQKQLEIENKSSFVIAIIEKLNASGTAAKNNETIEMLNDLNTKIKNEEKIPSYLLNGLKSALENSPELLELLNKATK